MPFNRTHRHIAFYLFLTLAIGCATTQTQTAKPRIIPSVVLASWNPEIRQFLLSEIAKIESLVPPGERIAVFDFDGTIFVERPIYGDLLAAIDIAERRIAGGSSLSDHEVESAINRHDTKWLTENSGKVILAAYAGMTPTDVRSAASRFLSADHPRLKAKWGALFYRPMVELIKYLRIRGFHVLIVTAAAQEHVRYIATACLDLPADSVVGKMPEIVLQQAKHASNLTFGLRWWEPISENEGKVLRIVERTGVLPIFSAGNSMGDYSMLLGSYQRGGFAFVIDHDDDVREYKYQKTDLLNNAREHGWRVVSMANDWSNLYWTCSVPSSFKFISH